MLSFSIKSGIMKLYALIMLEFIGIQDCGGTHITSTGVITSPNFPSDYNNNDVCLWIIRMPSIYTGITLRFTSFNTELNKDVVEVVL